MKVMEMMDALGEGEVVEVVDTAHNRRFTRLGRQYVAENPLDELVKVSTLKNRLVMYVAGREKA